MNEEHRNLMEWCRGWPSKFMNWELKVDMLPDIEAFAEVVGFTPGVDEEQNDGPSIMYVYGTPELGKTRAVYSLLHRLRCPGAYKPRIVTGVDLSQKMKAAALSPKKLKSLIDYYSGHEISEAEEYARAHQIRSDKRTQADEDEDVEECYVPDYSISAIFIDDVDKINMSDSRYEIIFNIADRLYSHNMTAIYTANQTPAEFARDFGPALAHRICGSNPKEFKLVKFTDPRAGGRKQ